MLAESQVDGCAAWSCVDLGSQRRVVLMITPRGRGALSVQTQEALAALARVLKSQPHPMTVTTQTVFLRDSRGQAECQRILARHFRSAVPVTNYVMQPPCEGAALAIEAWAVGGPSVVVERFDPGVLTVSYDGLRWLHCGRAQSWRASSGTCSQTLAALRWLDAALNRAGSGFRQVVRTWFYLGGITQPEAETHRYAEFNRARSEFYLNLRFCTSFAIQPAAHGVYPASTGIGTGRRGLAVSCLALETQRNDVALVPLENPRQTPAYAYHSKYSPQSPKFSRATVLRVGSSFTTWISGTASIVDSESRHPADIEKQTEQTIDNIRKLIAPSNFAAHGLDRAGASLAQLAKIRVYLKRAEDFAECQAICRRHFGPVPAIYAVADVCRPELLIEIEGVAFSSQTAPP